VSLAGDMDATALGAQYDRADVFVLPTRYEGYGMAVAEALARGLPVISTATGAIEDLVLGSGSVQPASREPGRVDRGGVRGGGSRLRGARVRITVESEDHLERLALRFRRVLNEELVQLAFQKGSHHLIRGFAFLLRAIVYALASIFMRNGHEGIAPSFTLFECEDDRGFNNVSIRIILLRGEHEVAFGTVPNPTTIHKFHGAGCNAVLIQRQARESVSPVGRAVDRIAICSEIKPRRIVGIDDDVRDASGENLEPCRAAIGRPMQSGVSGDEHAPMVRGIDRNGGTPAALQVAAFAPCSGGWARRCRRC